jgi:hypothetical protein
MVEAPTALDERSGPERRLIAQDVASIMGKAPAVAAAAAALSTNYDAVVAGGGSSASSTATSTSTSTFPPDAVINTAGSDADDTMVVVSVTAEVVRVRRVARFLAFATLRPLAVPTRVDDDDDDGENNKDEESRDLAAGLAARPPHPSQTHEEKNVRSKPYPLPQGMELQLIAGRSLMGRVGSAEAMEALLRRLKPQATLNPKP